MNACMPACGAHVLWLLRTTLRNIGLVMPLGVEGLPDLSFALHIEVRSFGPWRARFHEPGGRWVLRLANSWQTGTEALEMDNSAGF